MANQHDKAQCFRELHIPGQPWVLFNAWDAGSAKAVAQAGAKAVGTGSWSVAAAHGFVDGESLPLDLVIANLARIVGAVELPVTVDIESGYGPSPDDVFTTVARTIDAGAIGCNLEDSVPASGALRPLAEQVQRIRAARNAAEKSGVSYFINARSDVFFQPGVAHDERALAAILERALAYADAGADGLFAPGLADEALIAALAKASPLPVNVMMSEASPPLPRLAAVGVARISYGPGPYRAAMQALKEAARRAITPA
jgi:2-methylisocitrate lyase-like PEP mutase family enzyme